MKEYKIQLPDCVGVEQVAFIPPQSLDDSPSVEIFVNYIPGECFDELREVMNEQGYELAMLNVYDGKVVLLFTLEEGRS